MLTVGKLLQELKECPDDWNICFTEIQKTNFLLAQIDITLNSIWEHRKKDPYAVYKPMGEHMRIHMEAKPNDS